MEEPVKVRHPVRSDTYYDDIDNNADALKGYHQKLGQSGFTRENALEKPSQMFACDVLWV